MFRKKNVIGIAFRAGSAGVSSTAELQELTSILEDKIGLLELAK